MARSHIFLLLMASFTYAYSAEEALLLANFYMVLKIEGHYVCYNQDELLLLDDEYRLNFAQEMSEYEISDKCTEIISAMQPEPVEKKPPTERQSFGNFLKSKFRRKTR